MRPLFTVHAGEFLVGDYIGRKLKKKYDAWLPVRDSGVDLLLTPKKGRRRTVKIQVKFSRGFGDKLDQPEFIARGWYTLEPEKILRSQADVWVFVILTLRQEAHFVLVPLKELKRRLKRLKKRRRIWHLYITVYAGKKCFDTRDLRREQVVACPESGVDDPCRDYCDFLENWKVLETARE